VVSPDGEPELEAIERLRLGLQIMALRALGDPEAAEEAVQETLVRAVQALREGRPSNPENLGAFVHGIARHVIADVHRARKRSAGPHEMLEAGHATTADDPLTSLINTEERDRIRHALTQLSAGDRQILHLSFFEGLTPVEIAGRLGEPAPRIRKRKSRALSRLRRVFLGGAGTCHESLSFTTDE
jgi:RNA polymerase sigma-70 factor (ECF subfamily)